MFQLGSSFLVICDMALFVTAAFWHLRQLALHFCVPISFNLDMAKSKRGQQKAKQASAKVEDDTSCSRPEAEWYDATKDIDFLMEFCKSWTGTRWLHVFDLFSYNQGMSKNIDSKTCMSMDIRLHESHDVTTKRGVTFMLTMLMCLLPGALVTLAPPCSLFIWLSCSVHLRYLMGPYGNTGNRKVRLANLIVRNTAARLNFFDLFGVY